MTTEPAMANNAQDVESNMVSGSFSVYFSSFAQVLGNHYHISFFCHLVVSFHNFF